MIICQVCGNDNLEGSQYCDECGARLVKSDADTATEKPPAPDNPFFQPANITSVGVPPIVEEIPQAKEEVPETRPEPPVPHVSENQTPKGVHAMLVIERGQAVGAEFNLTSEETYIGRWDADNGIFPDVDLDAFDEEAKISRRHARITRREDGNYTIEDLGSTNGTYVNRGRRLIPGNPNPLKNDDEIIVGKTFLRFRVNQ